MLLAAAARGAGALVALAVDPAADGRGGWELLPEVGTIVGREPEAPPGPRANGLQLFTDPGGLPPGPEHDPQAIADLLARAGARVAEVAAWDDDFTAPANDYDYGSLIAALHARGILAYAWLEPPLVTLRLFQDHPECR